MPLDDTRDARQIERQEQELCYSCGALNPPDAAFCRKCTAPLRVTSNIDPVKVIWGSRGFILWRLLHGRPTPFAYRASLLLLTLWAGFCLLGLLHEISKGPAGMEWGFALHLLLMFLFSSYVLVRVHSRWRKTKLLEAPRDLGPPGQPESD